MNYYQRFIPNRVKLFEPLYKLLYRSGKDNEDADCLSRNPINEFNEFLKEYSLTKEIKVNWIETSDIKN